MSGRAERSRAEASDELLAGPIRGDLLGAEHLAARARSVARDQRLVIGKQPLRPARLLARLADTRSILADAHARLLAGADRGIDGGPAAEWLLDNFHVVQEQLLEVRDSLPRDYYRELPELSSGPLTGYPRVYEIAISLISHTEARIDLHNVDNYVGAFQSVSVLSIGELWAIPAMLRLGLIESVRRMTLRTVQRLDEIDLAEAWAERIRQANGLGGHDLRAALKEFAGAEHPLTPHFVSRFLQSLRQTEGASVSLEWLEHWLREVGVSPEKSVAESTNRLTLTQLIMANSVMSLRDIGRRDWREFVEHQSAMEKVLRTDPVGAYHRMTFTTRDAYRHVVERIAKRTTLSEVAVAQHAVDLARLQGEHQDHDAQQPLEAAIGRRQHVGYFLVDAGLSSLEGATGYSPGIGERIQRLARRAPDLMFYGGLFVFTGMVLLLALLVVGEDARTAPWLVLLLIALPAVDLAVTALHHVVTTCLPPRQLPRLDLHEHGVSAEHQTAVVVPTLLGNDTDVRQALEHLEVQFLANREEHLQFVLLSDFTDAPHGHEDTDEAIIEAALHGIHLLNERHAPDSDNVFFLLHRSREWNAQQGVWMGWERKRGKLLQFNRFLRGVPVPSFTVLSENVSILQSVRYVITLDADTALPPDAAPSLIGAMAHPLNRAVFDTTRDRMVYGYGILQPRVGISMPSAQRSRFASVASGHPGVDPYSTAVSDVYQDLYGEGSFTGKGIYDVDAFEMATRGRFPENALLSHDLIEGNYARAGLLTDVIVYDDFPSTYISYARRKHRWIRGDWQLLPWLARYVPGVDAFHRNGLSLISQWKIIDNLRRSTLEVSQLLLLLVGWLCFPDSILRWTLLGLGVIVAPWVVALVRALLLPPADKSWRAYYGAVVKDAWLSAQQASLTVVFLPHQAWLSLDAITRTAHRLMVSKRLLLEWRSAQLVEQQLQRPVVECWRAMRGSVAVVAIVAVGLFVNQRAGSPPYSITPSSVAAIVLQAGLLLSWVLAPWIAARFSQPKRSIRERLSDADRTEALRYARTHWAFFSDFVTAQTHWLAPDNFQSDPEPVVAMRTSPTNIGLQLLATVSAHDLGFITAEVMTRRLEQTMSTMMELDKYRGHFYNWYDLQDLHVLSPAYISTVDSGNLAGYLVALRQACMALAAAEPETHDRLQVIANQAYGLAVDMDFGFLYDHDRKLFTIGYHPDSFSADDSFYDLLASEARLASFIAIAKNDVPVAHWFRLSRSLNRTSGAMALVSWSGSMFEYLMPLLVMRSLPFTLLDQTYDSVVERQQAYAKARGVPWGTSESAYNLRDRHQTYQYRAFGVADLGLKRGLARDLVIAPYATALAAHVAPSDALSNLALLERMGALGPFGFCDALDYTRPEPGHSFALVHAYMAHHIGMTLVSLTNVLRNDLWQERFHADPLVKSVELLLHERVPRRLSVQAVQVARPEEVSAPAVRDAPMVREVNTRQHAPPRVALLGSRPYTVMLNHSGGGYSQYESLAVTRWPADGTTDDAGQFCYIRDLTSGRLWSTGTQPIAAVPDWSQARLALDQVMLHRADGDIETRTEITVVAADSAEVRRVTLTNNAQVPHDIELTSYGEIVMAPRNADRAHPAFSNLFLETEWHAWCSALTAVRRPRSAEDVPYWCVHLVDAGSDRLGDVTCETDRAQFLGRGRSVHNPAALDRDATLSGTTGAVLDPIFAIRVAVRVPPGQAVSVTFTTIVATGRESAFALAGRYHESHAAQRALDFAWSATSIELQALGLTTENATLFQDLATQLLFPGGSLAPPPDEVERNRGSQPRLWSHGISGDVPIVLATIEDMEGLPTLRELFQAHRYWRQRGLVIDLVIVNSQPYNYLQLLRDSIVEVMTEADDATLLEVPGGVFIRRRDVFLPDDYLMLSATAHMHVPCDGRALSRILSLAEQRRTDVPEAVDSGDRTWPLASIVSVLRPLVAPLGLDVLSRTALPIVRPGMEPSAPPSPSEPLICANGLGGLTAQNDYLISVHRDNIPPAPWVNVIANPHGGFVVSERGSGCMWAENSYFFRLTPWHNDPVSDPPGDVIYLQDITSGDLWSATPAPVTTDTPFEVRHSTGSTSFTQNHHGIHSELELGIPEQAAVKISVLRLRNAGTQPRRLKIVAYAEWTLGARRDLTRRQVNTWYSATDRALFARNSFDPAFAEWTAFFACSEPIVSHCSDRLAFLGRYGLLDRPAGLRQQSLDDRTGCECDPCAALQMQIELAPGETRDIVVLLGAAPTEQAAVETIGRLRSPRSAREAMTRSVETWRERLGVIRVETPEPTFDAMVNTWTLYQTLSCRMWARTALYQSSGAYGFRDQLQDTMALLYAEPELAREHVLRAAARQFVEGDVQHWWHPHTGRGVRTRFSDDLAWLPFVVDQYVRVTGDDTILSTYVPFLTMRELAPAEHELYDLPAITDEHGDVYEHCRRALRRAATTGAHGLPLIGTGDWNDGMSLVGAEGRGESIWLAWFLIATLRNFAVRAEARGDTAEAAWMRAQASDYQTAIEAHGWDGNWYRRAFFDDGAVMGSAENSECRIDSIAQSWSVISGAGLPDRAARAMDALEANLVNERERLILLLTPPFDTGDHNPGYIKGYLPGIRENGAQYTHAALWAVQATAMAGHGDRAFELFQMLNPLTHCATADDVRRYKVEPYVVAADVYTAPQQLGRGGWTWYTGSASWMYRVGLENLLGFIKVGNTLQISPQVPSHWPSYRIEYRFGNTTFDISVLEPAAIQKTGAKVRVDGLLQPSDRIVLIDDGSPHMVTVSPK